METDPAFYFERLYPLQDLVLEKIDRLQTGFYLSGGTAASRGYLQHRFSDDLVFFVNDNPQFRIWSERIIAALAQLDGDLTIGLREHRFVRLELRRGGIALKIEMVDDVPARVGAVRRDPVLGLLDTRENILANKLTALVDRREPKDLADVWGFCVQQLLSLTTTIAGAQGKAVGLFAPEVARLLLSATREDWELVRWITPPDVERYLDDLRRLGEDLLLRP